MNKYAKWDSEVNIDQLIRDYDETYMSLPDIEGEPHLLISKVRKHYMDYMIKILSTNYETNQMLVNKNIYLPSAIWRCAKKLEMKAAQTCMVVQLYRKCIVSMINEVTADTKKGRLYNKLYESLHLEPQNEKRTQTTVTGDCPCQCNEKKRRRKKSSPAKPSNNELIMDQLKKDSLSKKVDSLTLLLQENNNLTNYLQRIPVVTNMQTDQQPMFVPEVVSTSQSQLYNAVTQPATTPLKPDSDDLMQQLEALFCGDKDDDDLFANTLVNDNTKTLNGQNSTREPIIGNSQDLIGSLSSTLNSTQGSIIENHAAQIKSLDERLSTLTGMLTSNEAPAAIPLQKPIQKKPKHASKWLCEEYYLKKNLFELLYQISDSNRQKLARIKELYKQLFGEDSDDEEGAVSPAPAESSEFVESCKSRIDSWVMGILAPYYARGRIQGKPLYKAVARHLIELIYKCKPYPGRHEVTSFVMDFLENRGKIRCEADFKEFRIDNVHVVPF